ncbi:MAG: AAA domain-containing protein [Cytophagales bacterium]|nr:AAA domain-containing protein [Cytophagales bacterium]
MRRILQSYLRKLTNLSTNNRSLFLLRLVNNHFLDLHELDFINNAPSFGIIESLLTQKAKINICQESDSRHEPTNMISHQLKKIDRTEKFIYEERGAKDLYIAWPFVRGKFKDGTPVRAPLIFFPVTLELKQGKWILSSRSEVNVTFNKSFILAYAYYNKVKLDETLIEYNFEEGFEDSREFRTSLYRLLQESNLEINFNQENFADQLSSFEIFKKKDFEAQQKNGRLTLFPEAVLGIFPQAGSYIVPDYLDLIERPYVPDLEEFFSKRSTEDAPDQKAGYADVYRFLDKVKEEQTFTPYRLDAYQENALKAVKKGNSVVIQGPPGTGKSQLICNLISDFIARGKKVLMVCQKRAALDVVYRRLKEKDLADFVALVHDFKNDRRDIYAQIAGQVDKLYEYKLKNNSLDSIQMERKFLQSSRRIDQINEEFEEYKFALFDEAECGISAKELYLTCELVEKTINLKQEYRFFKFDTLDDTLRKFRNYFSYALEFDRLGHPWYGRKSFKDFGIADLKKISSILNEIPKFQEEISKEATGIVNSELKIEDCEAALYKEKEIHKLIDTLKSEKVYKYFRQMMAVDKVETDLLWLTNTERVLLDCFKGEGPEISLKASELGRFQEVLQRAIASRKNLFRSLHWQLFSKDKFWIKRVIVANEISSDKKSFSKLIEKVDNRLNFEHNLSKLIACEWLIDLPEGFRKADFQSWFYDQKSALASKLAFVSLRNFKAYFNVLKLDYPDLKSGMEALLDLFKKVVERKQTWLEYLTPFQINHILENSDHIDLLDKSLKADFDSICEFDQLSANLENHERQVINKLLESSESPQLDELLALFDNSLRLTWLDHIETKYPILRSVSSLKFEQMELEMQENVAEKLSISKDILLLKTREITYEDAQYNRLNNMITYKELYHQVTKKRKIWPIRKVIANFSDELFRLVPCWMSSPESVSALFPMEEFFDLVIFDEASQCFAEKGIPAMYRGKQIVVAGDDKQLRPNDLYKVRWEEEEEELAELELDSLLELSAKHLMQLQLQGHYRSKSLDLIDFSNRYFYDGNLKLLPDFKDINYPEPPIHYIKVAGIWKNNINDIEGQKVVGLVREFIKDHPEKEIGVVTFNIKQQEHILDLLDKAASNEGWSLPESFFVKNIENVQGDEKDIIIFSTAYGPDERGKIIMQFGSLNATGGENRLNVAITRAREKIYIVSSLLPSQLKVDDSKNEGPRLLKKYLQFAKDVSEGNFTPQPRATKAYHINWFLKSKINEIATGMDNRYELANELPFTDLSVKEGQHYKGLVLTDDDIYHQSISVKEPHVYRPFTLLSKNWKFISLTSRQFWQNREGMKEKLMRFFNRLEE